MAIQFGTITSEVLAACNVKPQLTHSEILDRAMIEKCGVAKISVLPYIKSLNVQAPTPRIRKAWRVENKGFGETQIVETIVDTFDNHIVKVEKDVDTKGKVVATSFRTRSAKVARPIVQSLGEKNSLLHKVCALAFKRNIPVTFIGKRTERVRAARHVTSNFSCMAIVTHHHAGKTRNIDVPNMSSLRDMVVSVAHATWKGNKIHERNIKVGDSGCIIPREMIEGTVHCDKDDVFIVRGRYSNLLMDAQSYLPMSYCTKVVPYSTAEQYWKGFDVAFRANRSNQLIHEPGEKLDVEQCGSIAAILHQSLLPCCKITCTTCSKILEESSAEETRQRIGQTARKGAQLIRRNYRGFEHVYQLLMNHANMLDSVNSNREACGKVQYIIGERTDAPFSHVLRINETLIKGNQATASELSAASNHLLEIARYLKNRTENIQKGSLRSFRNKVSAKAHLNPQLLCDNQLDADGNFVWGDRAYHAKRFFSNFFEEINPEHGYDKYIIRKFPNGSRKLAIGQLILSTNLDRLREQLVGEPIKPEPLTDACVSKIHETFIYPCSCVTYDDGTPVLSEMKAPTSNHLVLVTQGIQSTWTYRQEEEIACSFAKEGYCYMNIFLAMLVNVDKDKAKDFTKWVRDTIVTQLGQWPTITDVALACFQLSIMFPSVRNAELPRILVDHHTKTLHVLDSYGSLTTGFHILKMNTVDQLIKIANETLESEIKHYRVGGTDYAGTDFHARSLKQVIRGVYRPSELRSILNHDPYILTMALLSPAILTGLFTTGSLYQATLSLIPEDTSARHLVCLLTSLAGRVSRLKDLHDQVNIIEENLGAFLEILSVGDRCSYARAFMQRTIEARLESISADEELDASGFRTLRWKSVQVLEKIYTEDLEASWQDLQFVEKCYIMLQKLRWRRRIIVELSQESAISFKKVYEHCSTGLHLAMKPTSRLVGCCTNKFGNVAKSVHNRLLSGFVYGFRCVFRDLFHFVQVLAICNIFLMILDSLLRLRSAYIANARQVHYMREQQNRDKLEKLYSVLKHKLGMEPTFDEFKEFVSGVNPELLKQLEGNDELEVEHQAVKRESEARLEQIVAFIALVLMVFDNERSDCVYRVMNKLKNVVGVADQDVNHQSMDDENEVFDDNATISFELECEDPVRAYPSSSTLEQWWDNQLALNRTIPHYRTEGYFMEFTRANCAQVINEIVHNEHKDILLRGAVGSGKSTGLPAGLSTRGKVLLLESTKPLSRNVFNQLRQDPFHLSPSLMMRDSTTFGSTPITIMTSGYAFHYFANNAGKLRDYQFVMIDECHVLDANAMAFRCLLEEHDYQGKIIKVSATPPGREVEFTTQHKVEIRIEDSLSFQQFVATLGTKGNADVTDKADNILVYVASYNEVDKLSKLLQEKGYLVTKVDGRTMKNGVSDVVTKGTPTKKHFIVATNIIENGVTLDIEAVVDFGTKVVPTLDTDSRRILYSHTSISYGERIQRLGRVGRFKPGVALRIGHTQKGICAIPSIIATEAAFLCFIYGLPVMTSQVSTSLLRKCTVQQARVMKLFELPTYFMLDLVRHDGTMHPDVHRLLTKYKLRESEIVLNRMAIPHARTYHWMDVRTYNACGTNLTLAPDIKIPFYCKDLPEQLLENLWSVIQRNKGDAGFRTLKSHDAAKIAYKLHTDEHSIQRTVAIIDALIIEEQTKKAHFDSLVVNTCSSASFSLQSVSNALRARYKRNNTTENISVLMAAKAQLLDFQHSCYEESIVINPGSQRTINKVMDNGALETVLHQSREGIIKSLNLQGKWKGTLLTRDLLVCAGVACGGVWLLYQYVQNFMNEPVEHQAKNKRQKQKLKFRDARDRKVGRIIDSDGCGEAVEWLFGDAYTKKGKRGGKTRGMGTKTRRFVNMYGFDEAEFTYIRFVDPVTGEILDESVMTDISIVQDHFGDLRREYIGEDKISPQALYSNPGIKAYLVKNKTSPVLEVDLTLHEPLKLCDNSSTIAGFPEKEGILRQTGPARQIKYEDMPGHEVEHESKSLNRGLRDYTPISKSICLLQNTSDGCSTTIHGVGYGSLIVSNAHLLKRNNGTLTIKSMHGEFKIQNTTAIRIAPVPNCDLIVLRLPKDFPPFSTKLKFRVPESNEQVCMVGTNFQEKWMSSTVSSTSYIQHIPGTQFVKHWIDTKDGHCGLPMVASKDGAILGLHSLTNTKQEYNCFASATSVLMEILDAPEHADWRKGWMYNPNDISWGFMRLKESTPSGLFKPAKSIRDLELDIVNEQAQVQERWFKNQLHCNLKAVGHSDSQLVTKHVIKGKCPLFERYLCETPSAAKYFRPLMGAYQKSRLNRVAYAKDALKYATIIECGLVEPESFEQAIVNVIQILKKAGFSECAYITDPEEIFANLNMKAAVGALYAGKKKDYFSEYTQEQREEILQQSAERLYKGFKGVWNGAIKAELRTREKVEADKTRTFTAAPIDTLLAGKICVDDFNLQFYSLHTKAPWSVGISKFSCGWDALLRKLPDGWIYCDADGSRFDSSLTPYIINAIPIIRLAFMEKWDIGEVMMRNLYTEIVYTPILTADGTIVKKFKGNNSGQPSTVVDNTLMVLLAMQYALERLSIDFTVQEQVCVYFANGDDLVVAVAPGYEHILDALQGYFSELGLNYDLSSRHKDRANLWFMSHKGVIRDGLYIPKLESERIVSILEWTRANEPAHRLEAICAAMVEAWGYNELLHEIRLFYNWILQQQPYATLAQEGKAPYISECALRRLYMDKLIEPHEYATYLEKLVASVQTFDDSANFMMHQASEQRVDATNPFGKQAQTKGSDSERSSSRDEQQRNEDNQRKDSAPLAPVPDRDINAGTTGTFTVPKLKGMSTKLTIPKVKGKVVVNLQHLLQYTPDQEKLSNTFATDEQFAIWYNGVKGDYEVSDDEMQIILNGLMVWCIENGTSPNLSGVWVMMDGEEQVTYPIKPLLDHAQPTFRQIMHHFSNLAEAYIEKRNYISPYMPRYGRNRNLTDMSLARYAFDFYAVTSRTPERAKEAHMQMKAAALRNTSTRMFGLDGKVGTQAEDTERHTAEDVNRNMHNLLGVRGV
uniref:Genome polyprotein n=1 Tax=Habenaria mosaic virus TaxID=1324128 RepID=A0A0M3UK60_9POTV|nr:polyprotein [Habenaria mosaic virus]